MLELVFTVCSVVQGASCKELAPITFEETALPVACMMASQIEAARWVDNHPNFYIQRATCQPARTFAKI